MNSTNSRDKHIDELEQMAGEVLDLKKQFRQRRPIVIEFCGSPKAGKTSCINSLNIFLKRNGFKTCILSERASVSPISDKHNPIFNVWTCTSAINEINQKMDEAQHGADIDVIISDRGIFDALCWFEWLKNEHNMSKEEYNILSHFVTFDRWRKNIDLVCIFIVSPEESIKREYANLLTVKRGSIMRESVLQQYLDAVEKTAKHYKHTFRTIYQINTTAREQNDVGFDVTKKTLEVLRNMLIEKIGYVPAQNLKLNSGINEYSQVSKALNNYRFNNRDIVESDQTLIQPIPIAVVTNKQRNKLLCIKKTKKSTEPNSPERDKLLLYVGGHTRLEDKSVKRNGNFLDTARKTLERELLEELGISYSLDYEDPFILYTPDYNPKSKQHFAVGWIISIDEDTRLSLDSYEIVQKKGISKSGSFLSFPELEKLYVEKDNYIFESWSKDILLNYFSDKCSKNFITNLENNVLAEQLSFFID